MEPLAKPGDFCPNAACPAYDQRADGHAPSAIRRFGKTTRGVQRYQCRTCRHTFTATRGTIFFGKRTPERAILETLALLAEGNRISSVARVKGFKEDTISAWLRQAADHAERLEGVLMQDFKIKREQLDALWAYVGNKGEKKLS